MTVFGIPKWALYYWEGCATHLNLNNVSQYRVLIAITYRVGRVVIHRRRRFRFCRLAEHQGRCDQKYQTLEQRWVVFPGGRTANSRHIHSAKRLCIGPETLPQSNANVFFSVLQWLQILMSQFNSPIKAASCGVEWISSRLPFCCPATAQPHACRCRYHVAVIARGRCLQMPWLAKHVPNLSRFDDGLS